MTEQVIYKKKEEAQTGYVHDGRVYVSQEDAGIVAFMQGYENTVEVLLAMQPLPDGVGRVIRESITALTFNLTHHLSMRSLALDDVVIQDKQGGLDCIVELGQELDDAKAKRRGK